MKWKVLHPAQPSRPFFMKYANPSLNPVKIPKLVKEPTGVSVLNGVVGVLLKIGLDMRKE